MALTRELEIAWAAGLFEGEGSMRHPSASQPGGVTARLDMTDFDVVERFHAVVGVGSTFAYAPAQPHWKEHLIWAAGGAQAIVVIGQFLPYFGKRRAERARECIEWFREHFVRVCPGCRQTFVSSRRESLSCSKRCAERLRLGSGVGAGQLPLIVQPGLYVSSGVKTGGADDALLTAILEGDP